MKSSQFSAYTRNKGEWKMISSYLKDEKEMDEFFDDWKYKDEWDPEEEDNGQM